MKGWIYEPPPVLNGSAADRTEQLRRYLIELVEQMNMNRDDWNGESGTTQGG